MSPDASAHPYCCVGCRTASALLSARGLERFYELRGARGVPVGATGPAPEALWLQAQLCISTSRCGFISRPSSPSLCSNIVNNLALPVLATKSYSAYAGVQDALVQGWYGPNAVALFLTTPVLGIMYYVLPQKQPSDRCTPIAYRSFTSGR